MSILIPDHLLQNLHKRDHRLKKVSKPPRRKVLDKYEDGFILLECGHEIKQVNNAHNVRCEHCLQERKDGRRRYKSFLKSEKAA